MQKNMRYQKKAYILITIWLMEIQILKLVIVDCYELLFHIFKKNSNYFQTNYVNLDICIFLSPFKGSFVQL
jgi:hypothetical protein